MKQFGIFTWRVTSLHMITYFLAGVFAYYFFDYQEMFVTDPFSCFMRPTDSQLVAAGPVLQVFRGVIFSIALWWFRSAFLNSNYGWLKLWGLLVGLSILSTTGAAPGSIEGMIYTTIPLDKQILGYLEVLPQTLLFSLGVYYWYKRPKKVWTIISIILVSLIVLMSLAALFLPVG